MTKPHACSLASLVLLVFILFPAVPAGAHPHAFVEAVLHVVFDDDGLAGFRQRWVIDEMTTVAVLETIRENGDGVLDEAEREAIKRDSFGSIKQFGYFTHVVIGDRSFEPDWATDFHAELVDGRFVYTFFIPCHVKASEAEKVVKVALYDPSFYTYVAYVPEDADEAADPTADPLFGNPAAQADPGDYERFSEAMGLDGYDGVVPLDGPADRFTVRADVVEAPDMAYFYEQIIPEAFHISFARP